MFPVFTVIAILDNAQGVDPEILDTEQLGKTNYIPEHARQNGSI